MSHFLSFLLDRNTLLYIRGFIYLYNAIMTLLAATVYVNPDARLWSWAYRARMLTLSAFFFILATGGISAYLGFPELGQTAVTYGATVMATIYAVLITMFVVFRK